MRCPLLAGNSGQPVCHRAADLLRTLQRRHVAAIFNDNQRGAGHYRRHLFTELQRRHLVLPPADHHRRTGDAGQRSPTVRLSNGCMLLLHKAIGAHAARHRIERVDHFFIARPQSVHNPRQKCCRHRIEVLARLGAFSSSVTGTNACNRGISTDVVGSRNHGA